MRACFANAAAVSSPSIAVPTSSSPASIKVCRTHTLNTRVLRFQQFLIEANNVGYLPVKPQEVTGALRAAKFPAHFRNSRINRDGYRVRRHTSWTIVIFCDHCGDTNEDILIAAGLYERCLLDAGFEVKRPFPDQSILQVKKRAPLSS